MSIAVQCAATISVWVVASWRWKLHTSNGIRLGVLKKNATALPFVRFTTSYSIAVHLLCRLSAG
jgi:hypothetical protein